MPPEIRSAGSKLESRSCADCSFSGVHEVRRGVCPYSKEKAPQSGERRSFERRHWGLSGDGGRRRLEVITRCHQFGSPGGTYSQSVCLRQSGLRVRDGQWQPGSIRQSIGYMRLIAWKWPQESLTQKTRSRCSIWPARGCYWLRKLKNPVRRPTKPSLRSSPHPLKFQATEFREKTRCLIETDFLTPLLFGLASH